MAPTTRLRSSTTTMEATAGITGSSVLPTTTASAGTEPHDLPPSAPASSGSDDPMEDDGHASTTQEDEEEEDETMDRQHRPEMNFDPSKGIKEPSENDILCGRGRSTSSHPANLRFRALVCQNQKAYQTAKRREEKTRITEELVDQLRSTGRFILYEPKSQLWYEVSPEYAREKVSHSLRSKPERRRIKQLAVRKKAAPKKSSPALDDIVAQIIQDQQGILKGLMSKESDRMTAEAIMRATLGHTDSESQNLA